MIDFKNFEKKIGINFKNKELLKQAFTHRSYINENTSWKLGHNERLEFLGDAVLELVVTEYLYAELPKSTEGEMTSLRAALVNAVMLAQMAKELGMEKYLLLSSGEAKDNGRARQYILANTFESLVGAIYLDAGYKKAFEFLKHSLFPKLKEVLDKKLWIDAKSLFQEKAQAINAKTPTYKVLSETGPDHDKKFVVGVYIGREMVAEDQGMSKQEAEQNAARRALKIKHWED